jgi:hypothetical protein
LFIRCRFLQFQASQSSEISLDGGKLVSRTSLRLGLDAVSSGWAIIDLHMLGHIALVAVSIFIG